MYAGSLVVMTGLLLAGEKFFLIKKAAKFGFLPFFCYLCTMIEEKGFRDMPRKTEDNTIQYCLRQPLPPVEK